MPDKNFRLEDVDRPDRERMDRRLAALKNERSSWDSHWKDLADYILPRRQRFDSSWRNRGTKRNDKIINDTATIARRTLAAGMMAGLTSPSRPWFRLVTPDPNMMDQPQVRDWLYLVEERIRLALHRSNIYNCLAMQYGDLGVFGTSCLYTEDHYETYLRGSLFPVGSYYLALNSLGKVQTCYRETGMSVAQIAEKFGLAQCSRRIRDAYNKGDYDTWIDLVHVVEPRRVRNTEKLDGVNMPYRSIWYESGSREFPFLGESGYRMFPCLAPRWESTSSTEDVYGNSPGMDCLGDIKALQTMERRKAQILDKLSNPPMVAPAAIERKGGVSTLPGGTTWVPAEVSGQQVYPAFQIDSRAGMIGDEIARHEQRIDRAFYADLFLLLAQSDLRQPRTATEIAELHEEKILQLGPVLERLDDELFDPLIDRIFWIIEERGELPPAPEVLLGSPLKVEYTSVLAAAQKLLGIANIERFVGFVGNIAAVRPDALDKLDVDQTIDEYGDKVGVPPRIIRSDDKVAAIRAARAQQEQMAQAAAMAPALRDTASAAKTLSEADTSGGNALSRLLNILGPRASAGVQAA